MKKILHSLSLGIITLLTVSSCLSSEEPYNAGFHIVKPTSVYTLLYANNTRDSIIIGGLGNWQLQAISGSSWCQTSFTSGAANTLYAFPVSFDQNTTGKSRYAQFRAIDTAHPDTYADWVYFQYATRGDGSMGNAALVRTITSSDGYTMTFDYDGLSRPTALTTVNSEGLTVHQLTVSYNESDSTITVKDGTHAMTSKMDNGYQTQRFTGERDTVGYYAQLGLYGLALPANDAFNFEHHRADGSRQAFSFLLNGQSLIPDSIHNIDSLKYQRVQPAAQGSEAVVRNEALRLSYGVCDNRYQSVDANQLLLGVEECHPMLLLSMFRYARSSKVVQSATSSEGTISMVPELNGDLSLHRLTVSDRRKGTETVYTFTY